MSLQRLYWGKHMCEQQALLNAIWQRNVDHQFDGRGIEIYRRNLLANARRALNISFPTVFMLLDSDVCDALVSSFLNSSPPTQGDWGQWGSNFSHFIKESEVGRDYPYLADCAKLDWHVHCALHGKDQTFDQTSLLILARCEPNSIAIEFNDNVALLRSRYPIEDIFIAHHHEHPEERDVALTRAQFALALLDDMGSSEVQAQSEYHLAIYRPEFQPKVTRLTATEHRFMAVLFTGETLDTALNCVNHEPSFLFEQWLVRAIEFNLIHYFKEC